MKLMEKYNRKNQFREKTAEWLSEKSYKKLSVSFQGEADQMACFHISTGSLYNPDITPSYRKHLKNNL